MDSMQNELNGPKVNLFEKIERLRTPIICPFIDSSRNLNLKFVISVMERHNFDPNMLIIQCFDQSKSESRSYQLTSK